MHVFVIDLSGAELDLEAEPGVSVMKIVTNAGVTDMLATCGGSCSCATCHVHVDPRWSQQLPPMSETENDLLDCSDHRTAESRLSCQIPFAAALDGMRVTIAAPD